MVQGHICVDVVHPLSPPRLLAQCNEKISDKGASKKCLGLPEFDRIRVNNNSIYLKPDDCSIMIGGSVWISTFLTTPVNQRESKTCISPQCGANSAFFLCGVLPESGGVRKGLDTLFTLGETFASLDYHDSTT